MKFSVLRPLLLSTVFSPLNSINLLGQFLSLNDILDHHQAVLADKIEYPYDDPKKSLKNLSTRPVEDRLLLHLLDYRYHHWLLEKNKFIFLKKKKWPLTAKEFITKFPYILSIPSISDTPFSCPSLDAANSRQSFSLAPLSEHHTLLLQCIERDLQLTKLRLTVYNYIMFHYTDDRRHNQDSSLLILNKFWNTHPPTSPPLEQELVLTSGRSSPVSINTWMKFLEVSTLSKDSNKRELAHRKAVKREAYLEMSKGVLRELESALKSYELSDSVERTVVSDFGAVYVQSKLTPRFDEGIGKPEKELRAYMNGVMERYDGLIVERLCRSPLSNFYWKRLLGVLKGTPREGGEAEGRLVDVGGLNNMVRFFLHNISFSSSLSDATEEMLERSIEMSYPGKGRGV